MASVLREPRSAAGSPRSCWEPDRHAGGHADLSRATQACHGPRGPAGGHADLPLKTRRQHGAPRATAPPGLGPSDASRCQEPPVRTPGPGPTTFPALTPYRLHPSPPSGTHLLPPLGRLSWVQTHFSGPPPPGVPWPSPERCPLHPCHLSARLTSSGAGILSVTVSPGGREPRPPEESALTDHMPAHGWGPRPGNKQGAPKTAFCLSEDMEETALNVGYGQRSAVTTVVLNAVDSIKNKQNWSLLKTHRSVTG